MAQPPLTQQIQRLERHVGEPLFDRTTRPVSLTAAGEALLPKAASVLRSFDEIPEYLHRAHAGRVGRLRVGCAPSTLFGSLPAVLRNYQVQHPDVQFSARAMDTTVIVELVENQELDVGFLRSTPATDTLHIETLHSEPLLATLPDDHQLAGRKGVRLAHLAEETFIMFPRQAAPENFDMFTSAANRAGFSPHIIVEAGGFSTQVGYVACGLGVAVVPESVARHLNMPGVLFSSLEDDVPPIETTIAWRAGWHSPVIESLCELARGTYGTP